MVDEKQKQLFVSSVEADDGKKLNEALVKRLTGRDTIKARFMGQVFFQFEPSISNDGRYITFRSEADSLVDNDTNGHMDIFKVANPLYQGDGLGNSTSDFTLQTGANNSTDDRMIFGIDSALPPTVYN